MDRRTRLEPYFYFAYTCQLTHDTHVPYVALTSQGRWPPHRFLSRTLDPSAFAPFGAACGELRTLRRAPVRDRVRSRLPGRGGDYETATNTRYRFNIAYRSGKPVTRVRGARWTRRVRSRAQRRARTFFDLVNFTPWFPGCALLRRALAREVRGVTTPCTPPPPHLALLLS